MSEPFPICCARSAGPSAAGPPLRTVSPKVEQVLQVTGLSASDPETARLVHAHIGERGISLSQIRTSLKGIEQRSAPSAPFIAGEDDPTWGPRPEAA